MEMVKERVASFVATTHELLSPHPWAAVGGAVMGGLVVLDAIEAIANDGVGLIGVGRGLAGLALASASSLGLMEVSYK